MIVHRLWVIPWQCAQNRKKLDFVTHSKKPKLDSTEPGIAGSSNETDTTETPFDDLSEEEQSFEQNLILIIGAKSIERLKSFAKKDLSCDNGQFTCILCGTTYKQEKSTSAQCHLCHLCMPEILKILKMPSREIWRNQLRPRTML